MKKVFHVQTAMITLFEAYPDDPKTGWMAARECLGSTNLDCQCDEFETIKSLLTCMAPNGTYGCIDEWEVSNVEDGGFLLNLDVIVDHDRQPPSPERMKAWKEGHAHLCHGYYSIYVTAQYIEDIPAGELLTLIEKASGNHH